MLMGRRGGGRALAMEGCSGGMVAGAMGGEARGVCERRMRMAEGRRRGQSSSPESAGTSEGEGIAWAWRTGRVAARGKQEGIKGVGDRALGAG